MNNCQMCGGELVVLGRLGIRVHLRCRDCGMEESFLDEHGEFEEEDEEQT